MKNIAVLVYELTIEYNRTVLNGIVDYFCSKDDVHLIISPVNIPLSNSSEFDYQYWSSVKVLNSENIDAFSFHLFSSCRAMAKIFSRISRLNFSGSSPRGPWAECSNQTRSLSGASMES